MPKMKIAVTSKPGTDFEIEEREIPTPGQGQVRIRVQACGICFANISSRTVTGPALVIRAHRVTRSLESSMRLLPV
jgi:D-arabinose 1-dehydrogenase-like Zn-dependent alcohol dehydrogenase